MPTAEEILERMRQRNAEAQAMIEGREALAAQNRRGNIDMLHSQGVGLPPGTPFEGPRQMYDMQRDQTQQFRDAPMYTGPMDSHYTGVNPNEPSTWQNAGAPPWMRPHTPAGMRTSLADIAGREKVAAQQEAQRRADAAEAQRSLSAWDAFRARRTPQETQERAGLMDRQIAQARTLRQNREARQAQQATARRRAHAATGGGPQVPFAYRVGGPGGSLVTVMPRGPAGPMSPLEQERLRTEQYANEAQRIQNQFLQHQLSKTTDPNYVDPASAHTALQHWSGVVRGLTEELDIATEAQDPKAEEIRTQRDRALQSYLQLLERTTPGFNAETPGEMEVPEDVGEPSGPSEMDAPYNQSPLDVRRRPSRSSRTGSRLSVPTTQRPAYNPLDKVAPRVDPESMERQQRIQQLRQQPFALPWSYGQ